MAKVLYLIGAPFLLFGIAIVLAADAALIFPPNVMLQAVFVTPVCFFLTSSVLAHFLSRFVIPLDHQGPNFRFVAFWGNVALLGLITAVLLAVAYFGFLTIIEGLVIFVVLFVAGQFELIRILQSAPNVYDVFDWRSCSCLKSRNCDVGRLDILGPPHYVLARIRPKGTP